MLLKIATTARPATDLGFLLHKHPDRLQEVDLPFGKARVAYTEASAERCEAMLAVDISHDQADTADGMPYVSDRPYSAGSYLTTAISKSFGTAMTGRCDLRPELAARAIPLEIMVTPVACHSPLDTAALFSPMGWQVEDIALPVDPQQPEWGSLHHRITLRGTLRLSEALRHLCVLLPVLDGRKHYFASRDEIDRLARLGEGWLETHPARTAITRRYLKFGELIRAHQAAIQPEPDADDAPQARPPSLQETRIATAADLLVQSGATRVLDLGCGEGDLLAALLGIGQFRSIVGVDPSVPALDRAAKRLRLECMAPMQRERISLMQGAATYPDARLEACDALALLEVIEHVEPDRLPVLESNLFGTIRPQTVVMTTPNSEWNATILALEASGRLRHRDHRFEWSRQELRAWARRMDERWGYSSRWFAVGAETPDVGPATQGVVFERVRA